MTFAPYSLCVYCGSRPGRNPAYMDAATELGQAIAASLNRPRDQELPYVIFRM